MSLPLPAQWEEVLTGSHLTTGMILELQKESYLEVTGLRRSNIIFAIPKCTSSYKQKKRF
jgi:hypothetical protein